MRRSHEERSMHLEEDFADAAAYARPQQIETFSRHLDPAWIEEALAATGVATLRRRRLPAEQVVWLVLGMGLMRGQPIKDIVRSLDLALPARGKGAVAPSAIPKARVRVGAAPIEWLFLRTASEWAHTSARQHAWRGLALYAVDGTTVRVADSEDNRRAFGGQPAGKEGRGPSGYPSVRLVGLMALRSHLLAAASFGAYSSDERTFAETLWASVPDRSVTILDRLYLAANVMVGLTSSGTDRHWLMRAKTTSKWTVEEHIGPNDSLVRMNVSDEARRKDPTLPTTIQVRAIAYQRRGFRPQTLLTSLLDATAFPAKEVIALYHERWEIELGYDEIKTEMLEREETIRSKSPAGVQQELWGILLAYNLVRVEMERLAGELDVEPVRISFVTTLRYVVEQWNWAAITGTPGAIPKRLSKMREQLARFLLPPRRSRSSPRAVKIKMSNYPLKRSPPKGKAPK
jgi:hypothetical protein